MISRRRVILAVPTKPEQTMRSKLTTIAAALIIFLFSCRRDAIDAPKPQADPKLKRSVTKDSSGKILSAAQYNDREQIIFDTAFQNGAAVIWIANEYNSKGKRTKYILTAPTLTPTGYHWMDIDEYVDDTIPVLYRHFLHGSQTLLTKHIYNASKQLVLDSNYHTAIGAPSSTPYTMVYTYDAQGRRKSETRLNEFSDSVTHKVYQYQTSANHLEVLTTGYSYNPYNAGSSLVVTDYNSSGKILSEKTYAPVNQLYSQKDYTYDVNGYVIKAITTDPSSTNTWEYRYTYNAFGRPDKEERFYQNKQSVTVFYYYE